MNRSQFKALLIPTLVGVSLFSSDAAPDFMREVKPLLEGACVNCHREDSKEDNGDYIMTTKAATFEGGPSYGDEVIKPGNANDSPVYWMTTLHLDDPEDPEAMPPKKPLNEAQSKVLFDWIQAGAEWPEEVELAWTPRVNFANVRGLLIKGGPFNEAETEQLRLWVAQGADWPEGVKIAGGGGSGEAGDNLDLVKQIREIVLKNSTEQSAGEMKEYTAKIPKTGVEYEMVAIPGGEFMMGSPEDEKERFEDEGPQHKVAVDPFWMGKFEVTWTQYEPFMITSVARNKDGSPEKITPDMELWDMVSSPTTPYTEMSFGMGNEEGFPAICMTQHAANKFCQWLSAQTGHFYRLPTEAEWEYACRAGATGPFHCDESELGDYAVFDPDQVRNGYEKVGTKKPNPFGLHDMHGNVMEWVIDQYDEGAYASRKDPITNNPVVWPTTRYPRVARGGSWYDPAGELRAARRIFSEPNWKVMDPQLPKSIWYHTDAHWLGFRLVRPLKTPTAEEMHKFWNIGAADGE